MTLQNKQQGVAIPWKRGVENVESEKWGKHEWKCANGRGGGVWGIERTNAGPSAIQTPDKSITTGWLEKYNGSAHPSSLQYTGFWPFYSLFFPLPFFCSKSLLKETPEAGPNKPKSHDFSSVPLAKLQS